MKRALALFVVIACTAGCFALEDRKATERCRTVQSKDECKRCCSTRRYMWTYETGKGGSCSCR